MLVVWVVFCLIHHDCKTSYSALAAMFGVPLRWKDLRHLCLEDREAWEAVGRVRGYLEANIVEGSELFQLSKPVPTLRFAEAYARQDAGMRKVLKLQKKDAEDRKAAYWAEVKAKKELVARLRQELAALEQHHMTLVQKLANLRQQLNGNVHTDPVAGRKEEGETQRQVNSNLALQRSKRSELAVAQKAPNPIFQPLPEKEGLAYSVIFMATMTSKLRLLARLSVLSQQMLLPTAFQRTQVPQHQLSIFIRRSTLSAIYLRLMLKRLAFHFLLRSSPASPCAIQARTSRSTSQTRRPASACNALPTSASSSATPPPACRTTWAPGGWTRSPTSTTTSGTPTPC
jgi:hypothetical protein